MPTLNLFVNTSNDTLVAGLKNVQNVDPNSLPFFYGDTLNLNVNLLQQPPGYNPTDPSNNTLQQIPTAGLQLFLYIDDGTVTPGVIYTQQISWTSDPTGFIFQAALALNTTQLATLLGTGTTASAWLKIGYVQNSQQTTVYSQQIQIRVGLPAAGVPSVPAGQTALSTQVAAATYWSLNPVKGRALYLESPAGKIFALVATDNPDGTASVQASPVN